MRWRSTSPINTLNEYAHDFRNFPAEQMKQEHDRQPVEKAELAHEPPPLYWTACSVIKAFFEAWLIPERGRGQRSGWKAQEVADRDEDKQWY